MNGPRAFPYGGVPVYNPQSLSKDEALAQFHAPPGRLPEPDGYAPRGAPVARSDHRHARHGEDHSAAARALRRGRRLRPRQALSGAGLPEEQYNVNRLHHFLLNTLDALADAMERLDSKETVKRIEKEVEEIGKRAPEEIEERVPRSWRRSANRHRRASCCWLTTADRLFRNHREPAAVEAPRVTVIAARPDFFGATTQASEGIYGSDGPSSNSSRFTALGP